MTDNDDFVEYDKQAPSFKPVKKKQRTGVIKHVRKQSQSIVHLGPGEEESEEGVECFQPIYEGDVVVGVIHKCVCGRTAELRFQYSD